MLDISVGRGTPLQLDRIHVFTFKMLMSLLPKPSWRTETDRVGGAAAVRLQLPTLGSGGLAIFMGHCYERGYSPVTLFVELLITALSLAFSCSGCTSHYRSIELLRFAAIGVISFR